MSACGNCGKPEDLSLDWEYANRDQEVTEPMSEAEFNVTFRGETPEQLRVGDKLWLEGTCTVRGISGDLVDITELGSDPQFMLGGVTVDLYANRLEVKP